MKSFVLGMTSLLVILCVGAVVFLFGFDNTEKATIISEKELNSNNIDGNKYKIIKIKDKVTIDTPAISQFPELARGCEVTSLAMLLQTAGVKIDKMTLAKQIKKDSTPKTVKKNKTYYGNPNTGFVGDIYSFGKPGYGVYYKPIMNLAEQYLPGKIVNLTRHSFDDLKIHLSDNRPVWIITNTLFKELPDSYFKTWYTSNGTIRVTTKEHSVLVTGYDQNYVYFNDPLTGESNKRAPISDFQKAWVQMGSQAITYLN